MQKLLEFGGLLGWERAVAVQGVLVLAAVSGAFLRLSPSHDGHERGGEAGELMVGVCCQTVLCTAVQRGVSVGPSGVCSGPLGVKRGDIVEVLGVREPVTKQVASRVWHARPQAVQAR